MNQETIKLLTDLHVHNHRQGPGSNEVFNQALKLSGIETNKHLQIVDIGCGTGAASIALAKSTDASITALDFIPAFLKKLKRNAENAGVSDRVTTLVADMNDLLFQKEQFDVIWSEGAIYNIGFLNGIKAWKKYLKPNGILVVTEITWLTDDVPEELRNYWEEEYPEIALASTKIQQLEKNGYTPINYFVIPPDCWLTEYYIPLQAGFVDFLDRHKHSEKAKNIVEAEQEEIELYKKYQQYYSYGCYIARKI